MGVAPAPASYSAAAMLPSRPSSAMREQTYPPPYPDGWYRVALSTELRRGDRRYVECLDRQMLIWRSDIDDSVHAMAAFCPHLGANLADGCIKSGRVQCPFHGWQLASDGQVAHIPYAKRLPVRTRQPTWPTCERYGQIFVYHRVRRRHESAAALRVHARAGHRRRPAGVSRQAPRRHHPHAPARVRREQRRLRSTSGRCTARCSYPGRAHTVPGIEVEHDARVGTGDRPDALAPRVLQEQRDPEGARALCRAHPGHGADHLLWPRRRGDLSLHHSGHGRDRDVPDPSAAALRSNSRSTSTGSPSRRSRACWSPT